MGGVNYGKLWEQKVMEDFSKLPGATIDRLHDLTTGFKTTSRNVADAIGYVFPLHFYIECKCCHGNTFPLSNYIQYDKMIHKVGIPGVRAGVILWWVDHKKVAYIPTATFSKLKEDGKKSVNIKMLSDGTYNIIEIPSETKRVFPKCDFTVLKSLSEGE